MKRKLIVRFSAFLFALALGAIAALPSAALTPSWAPSSAYKASTYYQNLTKLPRTGDKAFDTVAVALSQLDYREGNSQSAFGGKSAGSGNFTEYNYAFGKIGGTYGYAWCAAFVSWCLEQADAANSAGGLFASCTLWVERLTELGQYSPRQGGYSPKSGDLIFFKSAGVARASDHVGLVRYVKNGRVYTVEGNASNRVSLRDYKLTDAYIVGYGRPRYNSAVKLSKSALSVEDKASGFYTVTYDFLNVRSAASASSTKRGTLDKGDMVRVFEVKNGWGAFYYKDKIAYISLEHADFTSPLSYRVTYYANGGEGAPSGFSYFSIDTASADARTPTREGHYFVHWQDEAGRNYLAGAALPQGDLKLTAVWEPIPVTEVEPPEGGAPDDGITPETGMENGEFDAFAPDSDAHVEEQAPPPRDNRAARVAAGAAVGVLTATLLVLWAKKRFFDGAEEE